MQSTVTCRSCGTVLGVPKGGAPAEGVTCNWCGAANQIDPPKPAAANVLPPVLPLPAPANLKPAKLKAPAHKWADDEDDDGQPYDIPAEEITTKACAACGKEIAIAAVICVHCGHDHRGGKKAARTFSPIDKTWEQGWPFQRRLTLFLIFQALNAVSLVISLTVSDSAPVSLAGAAMMVALQAFVLGTYPSVRVRRNKKGQAEMTSTWRICLIRTAPQKIDWRRHEGVSVGNYDATSIIDLWMLFVLLPTCLGVIAWWWFVIRPPRVFAALTLQSGALETYLYRGLRDDVAKDIAQTVTDATGLRLETPL